MMLLTAPLCDQSAEVPVESAGSTDVEQFLRLLHPEGVFEIRIPNTTDRRNGTYRATASGYFNCQKTAAKEVAKQSVVEPPGIYVTINPVPPEMLGRALNRIEFRAKNTTMDGDVVRRHHLLIDIDPVRKSGTSATDAEMRSAITTAKTIAHWLTSRGWPEPLRMMSGNGAYLIYKIDLANDGKSSHLVESFIKALARRFSTDAVDVDTSVFNPSRIAKIGGTIARKGDHVAGVAGIEDRPHRRSIYWPPRSFEVVAENLIESVVNEDAGASRAEPAGDVATAIEGSGKPGVTPVSIINRCRNYIATIPGAIEGKYGHDSMLEACATAARFALSESESLPLIEEYNLRCQPPFNAKDLARKLSEGYKKARANGEWGKLLTQAGERPAIADTKGSTGATEVPKCQPVPVADFVSTYPEKRRPLIRDTLRAGETMNVIGASKAGKSWLILNLGIAMASGRPWLGRTVAKGRVLLVDNELHPEELSSRVAKVMSALSVDRDDIGDRLDVLSLRGQLADINTLARMITGLKDRKYQLITLDAFYRTLPEGTSENDNAQVTAIYNTIDHIAGSLDCAVVLNHHASKGDQSGKAITDIGSGAGSISRAADTHLTIRPHEVDGLAVLEGVCRSFKPIEPTSLKFDWPVWTVSDIEPRVRRPRGGASPEKSASDQAEAKANVIDALANGPLSGWDIRKATGMGKPRVDRAVDALLAEEKIIFELTTCEKTKKSRIEYRQKT